MVDKCQAALDAAIFSPSRVNITKANIIAGKMSGISTAAILIECGALSG
jgi:hypothetical protein